MGSDFTMNSQNPNLCNPLIGGYKARHILDSRKQFPPKCGMTPPSFTCGPVPAAAISICIAILVTAVILRLGIDATPYDTLDSQGRRLGFNDPISGEHYRIIIGNFHPSLLWKPARLYDLLLLIMQITGMKLLWSRGN